MRPTTVAVLLLALVLGFASVLPGASQPASASSAYDAPVDLTFPVAGPNTFIDDYDHCRGGSGCPRRHRATDIMADYGQHVHAAVGGRISFITGMDDDPPSYGYMISIAGDDGRTYNYIHLGDQDLGHEEAYAPGMARGIRVERGQHIGFNGHSGNASRSAPHLHFEIVDPDVTDPYGSNRMNPYASLVAARDRGDLPTESSGRFRDVSDRNIHSDDIEWLADSGTTRGCNPPANDQFCPKDTVTREQMAAFLVRATGLTATSGVRFKDVPAGTTFAQDIDRLATAGVTRGCNPPANDEFCPKDTVSREQMASFLVRAYSLPDGTATFRDVPAGSRHASDIGRLAAARVTLGCNPPTNDKFCPSQGVTREQLASFLRRAS